MRALFFALMVFVFALPVAGRAEEGDFGLWLRQLRAEAEAEGISVRTLEAALSEVEPLPDVIALDRKQPETTMTQAEYLRKVVPQARIEKARALYKKHHALLARISVKYGVQPKYIVALWGIESNFGERMGNYNVPHALATLAYDGRRSEYFRKELLNALRILDARHIAPQEMLGSWAGAMGQCQFMPTSFLNYAVDENGDGHKDIWATEADVFASIANYLSKEGWNPRKDARGNVNVLLKWNRSRYFAAAVAKLGGAIGGKP